MGLLTVGHLLLPDADRILPQEQRVLLLAAFIQVFPVAPFIFLELIDLLLESADVLFESTHLRYASSAPLQSQTQYLRMYSVPLNDGCISKK